jgi:hypothetical protein
MAWLGFLRGCQKLARPADSQLPRGAAHSCSACSSLPLPAGEHCNVPDGALFSVANAAVYGMVQALQAEFRDRPQRFNEVGWFVCGGWLAAAVFGSCAGASSHLLIVIPFIAAAAQTHLDPGLPRPACSCASGPLCAGTARRSTPASRVRELRASLLCRCCPFPPLLLPKLQ